MLLVELEVYIEIGLLVESTPADMALEGQLAQVNAHMFVVVYRLGELLVAVDALETRVLMRQHVHSDLCDNLAADLTFKLLRTQLHMLHSNMSTHGGLALKGDRTFSALEDLIPEVLLPMLRVATQVGALLLANFTLDGSTVRLLHMTSQVRLDAEALLTHGALVQKFEIMHSSNVILERRAFGVSDPAVFTSGGSLLPFRGVMAHLDVMHQSLF